VLRATSPVEPLLLVEDKAAHRREFERRLRASPWSARFEVVWACTRAEALAIIETQRFGLAIIDYLLPDGFGTSLAPVLLEATPDVCLVLASADHAASGSELATFHLVVNKPIRIDRVVERYDQHCANESSHRRPTLKDRRDEEIVAALLRNGFNVSRAACELGISRQGLQYILPRLRPDLRAQLQSLRHDDE